MDSTRMSDQLVSIFFQFGRNIRQISQLNRNFKNLDWSVAKEIVRIRRPVRITSAQINRSLLYWLFLFVWNGKLYQFV